MPTKVKIYRVTGDSAEMYAGDAREAVRNHPNEWAFEPFSAEQTEKAQKAIYSFAKVES
ncbi:hypothetical protein [Rhizobium sp. WL3]|uniref:hypothetical protein n=1 Tax=Rhizobium sp. WL3 TaxID=2603277 RepID=UPI00164FA500|nr:hypothetical protein [Rhizobium sp. WL3]